MGKAVNTQDPFAFKPEYNEQVPQNVPQRTISNEGQNKTVNQQNANDPFAFRPEYNADVKKKVGGTDSEIGITEPSPTQSELQSKRESANDFLINDIDKNDFFSKLAGQSDQYFSHTTPQRVNEQAASVTKNEVFKNPNSLQRYTDQRIKDINEELKNIERQKADYEQWSSAGTGAVPTKSITNIKAYRELSKLAQEKEQYKNQLKNNVAELAADQILSQTDLSSDLDVGQIGRKISAIADPEQEAIFKMAEKGGKTLPGIKREQINYAGLQAVKSYLARNPEIPNYDQIVKNVNDIESDMDERNPETTALRVKEKIGAQLYKEGKSSFFGFGYSTNTLKDAANNPATALTTSEKKIFNELVLPTERRLIGTDIPRSGFTPALYNAFEKGAINAGKTIGDLTGIRDESEQTQDLLNQEVEGSRYRPAGESPTAQAKLTYLNEKQKTQKLSDSEQKEKKELENYTYVRNGWSKFKDGVGDLTGQVAMIALTTKGLGGAGRALMASGAEGGLFGGMTRSAIGQALSNETVGLFATSYLNAYDGYKQQAIQLMPGEGKAANRTAYATVMSSIEALSERIFPDTKILGGFTKELSPAIKDITNKFINKEITQQVARDETQKAFKTALKSFGKEYLKSTGQEATEEAVVDLAQGVADSVFGGQQFDIVKTGQQALNTFLTTALYSPLVAGMAARGAVRQQSSQNSFFKSAITDMAANPAQYLQSVEDLQLDGAINQQEANEKIKLIKSANQYLKEIPLSRTVTTKVGEGEDAKSVEQNKQFDYPETSSYLLHRLNEGILTEQIENTTDEILKSKLNKDLKRSQEIRKGLFDGSIAVTPDLKEVTNNPEKAEELGIFDVTQVTKDELIGTPFEQEKANDEKESESKTTTSTEAKTEVVETSESKATANLSIAELKKLVYDNIDKVNGSSKIMLQEATPEELPELFQNIAEQAHDENSANQAKETFGEELVNYAKELYPTEDNISNEDNIAVGEMIDKKGTYKGQRGTFVQDGQAVIFKVDNSNREYELGNIDEIKNQSISDYEIEDEKSVVNIDDNGKITVRGSEYVNPNEDTTKAIQRNKDGDVTGVKLTTTDGRRRTFRGQVGEDLAYQITLREIEKNNEQPAIERFINEDEEARKTVEDAGISEVAEANTNESVSKVQREKIESKKIKNKTNEKQNSKEAYAQKGSKESGSTKEGNEVNDEGDASKKGNVLKKEGAKKETKAPSKESKKEIKTKEELEDELKKAFGLEDFPFEKLGSEYNNASSKESIKTYLQKAQIILKGLFPDIKVESYESSDEYYAKEQRPKGSRGFYDPVAKRIVFNLELINKTDSGYTVFHEAIHPIVNDIIGNNSDALLSLYEGLEGIKDMPGMEAVWNHMDQYFNRGGKIQKVEAITEFLALVADGQIKTDGLSEKVSTKIFDLINKIFDALGITARINTSNDLKRLSDEIKTAFQEGNIEPLKSDIKNAAKIESDQILDALKDEGEEQRDEKIKSIIRRSLNSLSEDQIKESIQKVTSLPEKTVAKLIDEVKKEQEQKVDPPKPPKPPKEATAQGEQGNIEDYEMTNSGEVNRFLSGSTWEDVFGENAAGDQSYLTQKLSDMLQDGKNMIAIAQEKWGGDVMMYGRNLFQLIQGMSNDKTMTNKKAVLLATFLGELQEAKMRSPERFDAISSLEKAVFSYYQNYMNVRGKEIVAGRLLRLYRDKYIGDIYADMILEKEQVKQKKAIQEAEQKKQIDDKTVEEIQTPITEEEKTKEDKDAKKKSDADNKKQAKKRKMGVNEAAQKADTKLKEIEEKLGKDGRGGLIDRIKEAIKKLNCK
jgi:hypothetical protein